MVQKEASKRLSAEDYLQQERGKIFPEYFYTFLQSYMLIFSSSTPILSPDEKIERSVYNYLLKQFLNLKIYSSVLSETGCSCFIRYRKGLVVQNLLKGQSYNFDLEGTSTLLVNGN